MQKARPGLSTHICPLTVEGEVSCLHSSIHHSLCKQFVDKCEAGVSWDRQWVGGLSEEKEHSSFSWPSGEYQGEVCLRVS